MSAARAAAVEADVGAIVEAPPADPLDASVVPADAAAELLRRHELDSLEALALLALPVARSMASPPISGYRVAAVGIEAGGSLVLGANLEFPGSDLGTTIHAEGFAALRVRRRGGRLATLALRSARPCAHCRQTLAEGAWADQLRLIDLEGNRRTLDDLYPHAFRPATLGMEADEASPVRTLKLPAGGGDADLPAEVATALVEAGARAHAPYSGAPSAVALRLRDGRILGAGSVESVAFNPTITAAQAALVELAAARAGGTDVGAAWLAKAGDGPVDPEPGFRALVGAVAPTAALRVLEWRATPA